MQSESDETALPFAPYWAFGATAFIFQLLLDYRPQLLFRPFLRTVHLPVLQVSVYDIIIFYLSLLMFLGGLIAICIVLSNLSFRVRASAMYYFAGWMLGWLVHIVRWWLIWGRN